MTNRHLVALVAAIGVLASASSAAWAQAAQSSAPAGAGACVALVLPSVNGVEGHATDVAAAVRELFTSFLTGPSIHAVSLDARLSAQALEEARMKPCEPVLFVTLTRKRAGGGMSKAFGAAAGTAAWYVPGGATVGTAAARAGVSAGLHTVSALASNTRAKDELRLEYKLQDTTGRTLLGPTTEQLKAKNDGEDLLTPLVEKAAGAVAAAAAKK